MPARRRPSRESMREQIAAELRRDAAIEQFRHEKPQQWVQFQRLNKLNEIQERLDEGAFPEGSCFLHANLVGTQRFCVKRLTGVDLDTCQATIEIWGDDDAEGGSVVLPLETIEWFAFPARALPVEVHFQGFVGPSAKPPPKKPTAQEPAAQVQALLDPDR